MYFFWFYRFIAGVLFFFLVFYGFTARGSNEIPRDKTPHRWFEELIYLYQLNFHGGRRPNEEVPPEDTRRFARGLLLMITFLFPEQVGDSLRWNNGFWCLFRVGAILLISA